MRPWSAPLPAAKQASPLGPIRRCITGVLQHHLRDRVPLERIFRREHGKGSCLLGHSSPPSAWLLALLDLLEAQ